MCIKLIAKHWHDTVTHWLFQLIKVETDIEDACYIHCGIVAADNVQQETLQSVYARCRHTHQKQYTT